MDEPDLPLWLADMARQAERISRDTQSAVEMVISLEPDVRQPDVAAAAMAPSSAAGDLAQRQITGMTALLDAVRTLANSDLGGQLRIETRETVAKLLLHIDVNEVGSATEKVLADPGASAVIAQASDQLRAAGAGKLPPGQLFLVALIWLVCIGAVAAPEVPGLPAKLDLPLSLAPAYLALALALQWRIQDRRKR